MNPNSNCKCIIAKDKRQAIHQYHFAGITEFTLATYLNKYPNIQYKMEYIGRGKIYSIEDVLQPLSKQTPYHFWKIKE